MKQLEQQVQTHVKEKTMLEEKLGLFPISIILYVFAGNFELRNGVHHIINTLLILAKQDSDLTTERKNFKQQLNELNNSTMISQYLQESTMLNNSSYMSAAAANGTADTNSVELCQTCHSGIGGVGEAAKKIKELALGIIFKMQ